jgi:hypothetical protein
VAGTIMFDLGLMPPDSSTGFGREAPKNAQRS